MPANVNELLVALAVGLLCAGCYGEVPAVSETGAVDEGGSTAGAGAGLSGSGGTTDGADSTAGDPTEGEPGGEDSNRGDPGGAGLTGDDGSYFVDGGFILPDSHANVMRRFTFLTTTEDGAADGFNLDGRVSDEGDPESCGHGDLTGLDGEPGIDNQLAEVWSLVGPLVGLQVEELLQGAINEGRVLLMVELVGAADLQNAEGVTLNLFQGMLKPDVGGQGLITPGQTFYYDYEGPSSQVHDVSIVDGVIEAGPVYFELPIDILDAYFIIKARDGRLRITVHEDGTMSGLIGGVFSITEVLEDLYETNAAAEAYLVTPIFEDNADVGPPVDGACDGFSVTLGFEGTTGWVVRYPEMEAAQ